MKHVLTTLGRAALVAIGFAFAGPGMAATATFSCPNGTLAWDAQTNTLTCNATASVCTISGATSAAPNTSVTLTASCPGTGAMTWTGGGAASCTGSSNNNCVVSETSAGSVQYTVTRDSVAGSTSAAHTINWSSTPTAPGGCSLSVNPTSGSAATNVTLTADCTSGTDPINIAWTGSGTQGNCPASFNVAGSAATCTINGVAATTTWGATFSNNGGTTNQKTATFNYNAGGGGTEYAACPANTIKVEGFFPTGTDLTGLGFGNGSTMVVKMVIPTTWFTGPKSFIMPQTYAVSTYNWSISRVACQFDALSPDVVYKVNSTTKKLAGTTADDLIAYTAVGAAGATTLNTLNRGGTYYFNFYGVSGCTTGDCGFAPIQWQ